MSEAPRVVPPGEFRVFVHSGQVRGISQYDTLCYFPHLVQQKAMIAALILEFQEALHQRVGHLFDDYVLDLALLDDPAEAASTPHQGTFVPGMCPPALTSRPFEFTVLLVEINPWDTHTGAALFNWEQDKQILEGSGTPHMQPHYARTRTHDTHGTHDTQHRMHATAHALVDAAELCQRARWKCESWKRIVSPCSPPGSRSWTRPANVATERVVMAATTSRHRAAKARETTSAFSRECRLKVFVR
jgi:hypothetical protein